MKLVIFGLTISSSWGNGHATQWRGLSRALARRGHRIVFFERDVPYYSAHRDLWEIPGGTLVLYSDWTSALACARRELGDADVAIVSSYCPDGVAAADLVLGSRAVKIFYDLDTPVTLDELDRGGTVSYVGARGLSGFDLVLSFTGGKALEQLRSRLGAQRVAALYGSVDPDVHFPVPPLAEFAADFSYIGTYAQDRQEGLEAFFLEPARRMPERRFLIAGAQYPPLFPWLPNLYFVRHIAPPDHAALYSSSTLTLNVTRRAMARMGYCPSGRLFEAAACGTPIVSDEWEGLDDFFEPGREIILARRTADVLEAIDLPDSDLSRLAARARERALEEHSAERRIMQLEAMVEASPEHAAPRTTGPIDEARSTDLDLTARELEQTRVNTIVVTRQRAEES
jgi:spore maturation protein CgeB